MRFSGKVTVKAVKLPEAGIVEIDLEAANDYNYPQAGAYSGRKGDKFVRRYRDCERPLVKVESPMEWGPLGLELDAAHVVAETYVGHAEESDLPSLTLTVQFAVSDLVWPLVRRLIGRVALEGSVLIQSKQLELPFKAEGPDLLRRIVAHDETGVVSVTLSTPTKSATLTK